MCVVSVAPELEVVERIRAALDERDAVVDLKPVATTAAGADAIARMRRGTHLAPLRMGTSVEMIDRTYGQWRRTPEDYERGLLDAFDKKNATRPEAGAACNA